MSDNSESFEEWKGQKLAKAARQIGKLMGQKILLEEKLQAAEERVAELEREYGHFVKGFDGFFKFMQEYCNDVCYLGNTHQDNAVAVIKSLEKQNVELREALEFYTHEKPSEKYGDGSVMKNHSWDIACSACVEKPLGQKARQTLAKFEKGEE